ncbi:hypothetical protein SO802_005073 [Lithocarpus litseifolius]|uniref:Uncharacterized protein n=1 Tax=Lithocarpus litseifolius TaxID=425828 RepID=A0AAW2DKW1_9ROSI
MDKSSVLFSSNTSNTQKDWIKDTLGVKEVERFETYLGLPTMVGRAKYQSFAYLKDKVWKKLQGWKGKLLSRAGKEILIKAVAQSIPIYTMGVFLLPGKLSQSKRKEGMGFRDLRAFNLAMLAKQGWRMMQNPESLIYQCFKHRYFPRYNLLEAGDSTNSSYVWKSLMAAMPILKQGSCWRVENGASISVMYDKWIVNHPTCKVLHPPEEQEWEWRVSDLIDPNLRCWDRELIWNKFHEEMLRQSVGFP